jgi:hypothetical protein
MSLSVYNPPNVVLSEAQLSVRRSYLLEDITRRTARRVRLTQWFKRQPQPRRIALSLALSVLLGGVGTALGVGVNLLASDIAFHNLYDRGPHSPKLIGSFVYITRGSNWALIAWRSNLGICLDYAYEEPRNDSGINGWSSCGTPVAGAPAPTDPLLRRQPYTDVVGVGMGEGRGVVVISAPVAPTVAKVEVELDDGRLLEAKVYASPPKLHTRLRFYLLRVQATSIGATRILPRPPYVAPVRALLAYDGDGRLLQRRVLPRGLR